MLHGTPDGAREPFGCGAINILLLTEQEKAFAPTEQGNILLLTEQGQ